MNDLHVRSTLAYLNLLDYLFGAQMPTFLAGSTQMAVNTAITMGILAGGVLARLRPGNPFARLLGSTPTAILLRRLLVISVAAPLTMAWLRIEGQRLGLYDTSFGTSLLVVGITVLSTVAIVDSARWAAGIEQRIAALELERDRFFELSLDMLAVFDAAGHFRRVNEAWEATLGYPRSELIGRSLFELIHPDDLERTSSIDSTRHGRRACPGSCPADGPLMDPHRWECRVDRWLAGPY